MLQAYLFVYLMVMVVLGGIGFAMAAIDHLAMMVAMVTLGFGVPLVFAATAVPYMAAFLPVVAMAPSFKRMAVALPVSVAAAAGWALWPHWQSKQYAEAAAAALAQRDVNEWDARQQPGTIEVRRPGNYDYRMRSGNLPGNTCDATCRELLVSGQIDWYRIAMPEMQHQRGGRMREVVRSIRYRAGHDEACAASVKAVAPNTRCVLIDSDDGSPAALRLAITDELQVPELQLPAQSMVRTVGKRTLLASVSADGGTRTVLRRTEYHLGVVARGSVLGPDGARSPSRMDRLAFRKKTQSFNTLDFAETLRGFGYALREQAIEPPVDQRSWREEPNDDHTQLLVSVLELPGPALSGDEQRVVSRWIMHARQYREWTPESIGLLRRIMRDPRYKAADFADQIITRQPAVAAALLPDMLDLIEAGANRDRYDIALDMARSLVVHDPAILAPYRDRILAAVQRGGDGADALILSVGRLGIDPTPYLTPFARSEARDAGRQLRGACFSESRWSAQLLPHIRGLVTQAELAKPKLGIEHVLKALMRHGDDEFVEAAIEKSGWKDKWRIRARLERPRGRDARPESYCR